MGLTRLMRPMTSPMSTATAHADSAPRYLADVLFTDPDVPHIPEQEWVEIVHAIAAGDLTAVRAIYVRSHAPVFALILRITDDRDAAQALTADVFHDVWRQASSYDPAKETVLEWIMGLARAHAVAFRRVDSTGKEAQ